MRLLRGIGRCVTGTAAGVVEHAAVALGDDGRIAWVGADGAVPAAVLRGRPTVEEECGGALLTAGLVDAHTHPVYASARLEEIARRTAGATYDELAAAGGGIAATVAESRQILEAGRAAGLRLRLHADELARTGGARLAAELGADSADHLLRVTEADARHLAAAGVVATLAPVTALAMGRRPPARLLQAAGVPLALATDHNPGTSGTTSMSLVIGLAVLDLGLSVGEALHAATAGGALSLRLDDRGTVAPGQLGDLVLWDADHEGAFAWALGLRPRRVWRGGEPVAASA